MSTCNWKSVDIRESLQEIMASQGTELHKQSDMSSNVSSVLDLCKDAHTSSAEESTILPSTPMLAPSPIIRSSPEPSPAEAPHFSSSRCPNVPPQPLSLAATQAHVDENSTDVDVPVMTPFHRSLRPPPKRHKRAPTTPLYRQVLRREGYKIARLRKREAKKAKMARKRGRESVGHGDDEEFKRLVRRARSSKVEVEGCSNKTTEVSQDISKDISDSGKLDVVDAKLSGADPQKRFDVKCVVKEKMLQGGSDEEETSSPAAVLDDENLRTRITPQAIQDVDHPTVIRHHKSNTMGEDEVVADLTANEDTEIEHSSLGGIEDMDIDVDLIKDGNSTLFSRITGIIQTFSDFENDTDFPTTDPQATSPERNSSTGESKNSEIHNKSQDGEQTRHHTTEESPEWTLPSSKKSAATVHHTQTAKNAKQRAHERQQVMIRNRGREAYNKHLADDEARKQMRQKAGGIGPVDTESMRRDQEKMWMAQRSKRAFWSAVVRAGRID